MTTLRNLTIGIVKLAGYQNIAAACRHAEVLPAVLLWSLAVFGIPPAL